MGRGGVGEGRAGLIFTCVLGAAPENQFLHLEMLLATEPAGRGQRGWAVPCKVRRDAASNSSCPRISWSHLINL